MNKGCNNYKVGDRVKIRQDLISPNLYGDKGYTWVYEHEMHLAAQSANFIGEIIGIYNDDIFSIEGYRLDFIPDRPYFNDAMIEGYAEAFNSADVLEFLDL